MSEEFRKMLYGSINEELPEYKKILLEGYAKNSLSVPMRSDMEIKCDRLVNIGILSRGIGIAYHGHLYYYLTEMGKQIAAKLKEER